MEPSHETFGQRFKAWRQGKGLSAYRIAKLTGVHPSFISNIESDRRPMPEAFMQKLAALPELGMTYETLRAWKIRTEFAPQEVKAALSEIESGETAPENPEAYTMTPLDGLYRLPLKMTVQAGPLQPVKELAEPVYIDWYGLNSLSTDLFCIQVQGDSMWPPIPHGAILLVRESEDLLNNEKYVVETEDALMTFKLIRFDKSGARLVPLNPEHPPIPLGKIAISRIFQVLAYKVDWS